MDGGLGLVEGLTDGLTVGTERTDASGDPEGAESVPGRGDRLGTGKIRAPDNITSSGDFARGSINDSTGRLGFGLGSDISGKTD